MWELVVVKLDILAGREDDRDILVELEVPTIILDAAEPQGGIAYSLL